MATTVPNVSGDDVGAFVGRTDFDFTNGPAQLAATLARHAAAAYTRGVGFDDPDAVPARLYPVILLRAVRLLGNPQQLLNEQRDGVQMNYGAAAQGFTYQEVQTLNDYRRTAASFK